MGRLVRSVRPSWLITLVINAEVLSATNKRQSTHLEDAKMSTARITATQEQSDRLMNARCRLMTRPGIF